MMKKRSFNKEQVYRRLLRNAAELWGMHETDLDSMDPLAKMLLGATSKEIERIGNELQSSDTRIFKRIAQFLLPDEIQQAIPAHAVIQVHPVETGEVTRYEEFAYEKRWRNKADLNKVETADVRFSPAGEFSTSDCKLIYRAQGQILKSTAGLVTEDLTRFESQIPQNEIYLGFRIGERETNEIRLYFDWMNISNKRTLIDEFSKLSIYDIAGQPVLTRRGIKGEEDEFNINELVEVNSRLEEKVNKYYEDRFLRFTIDDSVSNRIPPFLGDALDEVGENNPESIRWMKLVLPAGLSIQQMNDVVLIDNAIPSLNRSLHRSIYRMHKELNIKKLDFDNFFLEVERAESNQGLIYHECPSLDIMEMDKGSFTIRLGGTGRLDERDGYEYLNYVLDLLRDEKQSFASLDVTSTISDLRDIEQVLQRVKKRVSDGKGGSNQPYIIVKPHSNSENAHIYFWSTDGTMANGIPLNSRLRCRNSGLTRNGQVTMVTQSIGGRNEMDGKQMVQAYRSAVLSRGTVVTKRDIMEACRTICGDRLLTIKIDKGVMTSVEPGEGLLKTIDVKAKFKKTTSPEMSEHLRQQMQSELKAASNFAIPLRVLTQISKEHVVGVA